MDSGIFPGFKLLSHWDAKLKWYNNLGRWRNHKGAKRLEHVNFQDKNSHISYGQEYTEATCNMAVEGLGSWNSIRN